MFQQENYIVPRDSKTFQNLPRSMCICSRLDLGKALSPNRFYPPYFSRSSLGCILSTSETFKADLCNLVVRAIHWHRW